MQANPAPGSEKHFVYLDSARGIAALMVFAMHFLDREFSGRHFLPWLYMIFNGKDAVSFFFVLSGFVLSYKYIALKKPLDINRFCVTRVFRLFPPFFVIVVLCTLFFYHDALNRHTLLEVFVYNRYMFWEEALLFRFHNHYYYPGWTLSLELLVSFLMPLFIALALKDRRYVTYMLVAFMLQGGNFYFHFLLGIALSCNYDKITSPAFRQSGWYRYRYLVLLGGIILFSIRNIDAISPLGPDLKYVLDYLNLDFFFFTGFGAFIFIGGILISKNTQKILSNGMLVYLGKISYSIYLVHTLMNGIVVAYLPALLPGRSHHFMLVAMMLVYAALTLLSASLLHYAVELPFMRLGKRVAARVKTSLVVRAGE